MLLCQHALVDAKAKLKEAFVSTAQEYYFFFFFQAKEAFVAAATYFF